LLPLLLLLLLLLLLVASRLLRCCTILLIGMYSMYWYSRIAPHRTAHTDKQPLVFYSKQGRKEGSSPRYEESRVVQFVSLLCRRHGLFRFRVFFSSLWSILRYGSSLEAVSRSFLICKMSVTYAGQENPESRIGALHYYSTYTPRLVPTHSEAHAQTQKILNVSTSPSLLCPLRF
jgi:hypothetical protein